MTFYDNNLNLLDSSNVFLTTYGRTALLLALKAIPVLGKEVILPTFTCPVGVVAVVVEAGGVPVFVDINLKNLNFDILDLKKKITNKACAIISHHYFGMSNTEIAINDAIAKENKLIHIEDCCHSLGAKFNNKEIGITGDISIYSFTKSFICLGGGVLKCNLENLQEKIETVYNNATYSYIERFLTNIDLFNFYYHLKIVKKNIESINNSDHNIEFNKFLMKYVPYLWFSPFKFINKLVNQDYYNGNFFNIKEDTLVKTFPDFNLRMTNYQKKDIINKFKLLDKHIECRRQIVDKLKGIVPLLYPEKLDQSFSFSNYPLATHSKSKVMQAAKEEGIHLNIPWPAEGEYWKNQKTDTINKIKDEILLLGISPYWKKKEIIHLESFLFKNKALFYTF